MPDTPATEPISPKRKQILEELSKLPIEEVLALDAHVQWQQKNSLQKK